MRILLLGNFHALSNADQYAAAFRRLGHDVLTCGPRFTPYDADGWREGLLKMEWPPTPDEAEAFMAQVLADSPQPQYQTDSGETVLDPPSAWSRVDAVLTFEAHGDNPTWTTGVPDVPTALVVGDSHTTDPTSVRAQDYDHLFVQFRRADIPSFGHPSAHWLPAAADPSVWVHVPDMPKDYDVLFVGSTHPQVHKERVELIRFLKRELGEERVVVRHLFGERAALAMNRARVVLNRSLAGDLNMRVPEALCTGALLLTDSVDGLDHFGPVARYADPEQALHRVTRMLEDSGARWDQPRDNRTRHTYEHRAQHILNVLFPHKEKKSARSLFPGGRDAESGGARAGGGGPAGGAPALVVPDGAAGGTVPAGGPGVPRPTPERVEGVAPRVSVIIPALNHWEDCTWPLLRRLSEQRLGIGTGVETIVVDDGSTDTTAHAVSALAVFVHQENAGFAAACNTGAREARGEYLVFLNNDTEPQEGWLAPLLTALDGSAGIAGPWLMFPDHRTQSAGLEQHADGTWWNKTRRDSGDTHEVRAVTGACLAIKRDTFWRLGGFDEGYAGGGGCEDVDLCLRAGAHGVRVVLVPESVVIHNEGSTRASLPETAAQIARNQERLRERFLPGLPPDPVRAPPAALPALIPSWRTGTPQGNPTVVDWDGPDDVAQAGSLAAINRALWLRLPTLLAGTQLGCVRISHRWTGPDRAWDLPGEGVDHWVTIVPWEGMAPVPDVWLGTWHTPKHRAVITPSRHSARFFLEAGVEPHKVRVVPNGVDLSVFTPEGDRLTAAPGVFRVLFVGGLTRRKGIDLLYDAWRRAFGPEKRVRLVLKAAGTRTFYRDSTEYPPADLPNVQLIDQDDFTPEQMAKLYRSCDLLVLPSRGEAFGMPVLEAMACGLPVITPEGGPFDEFVPAGAGWRIPLTVDALAHVLWVANHRGVDREEMGKVGHAAAQAYGWDAIAQQYADVIKEVCS